MVAEGDVEAAGEEAAGDALAREAAAEDQNVSHAYPAVYSGIGLFIWRST